jgi:hypothetical protein
LWSLCCGMSSLTRGWVCNLLVQFAVTLGPKFRRTHNHILLSHLRLAQPGGPGPRIPYLYPPGTEWPSYTPGRWVPFFAASYDSQGYSGSILNRLHMGHWTPEVEVKLRPTGESASLILVRPCSWLYWRWRWVMTYSHSVSLSWCRAPIWNPWPDFFSDWQLLVSWCVVSSLMEERSVTYLNNCFWVLPGQSLSGPSPELSWVYLTAEGRSSRYRAPLWGPWPDFILILSLVTIALLFFL